MDAEQQEKKSMILACIDYLVNKNVKILYDNYCRDKSVHNEKIDIIEVVNMITQEENDNEAYRITNTMYLPIAASAFIYSQMLQH